MHTSAQFERNPERPAACQVVYLSRMHSATLGRACGEKFSKKNEVAQRLRRCPRNPGALGRTTRASPTVRRLCLILCPPPNRSLSENLCRALCRNPAIPAHIGGLRFVSLSHKREARKMRRTRINRASLCHSDFSGVASSRTDSRFDTVEVCGSSPHGPTIHFIESTQRQPGPPRSICVTRHHRS
jgi:hypothetical protein